MKAGRAALVRKAAKLAREANKAAKLALAASKAAKLAREAAKLAREALKAAKPVRKPAVKPVRKLAAKPVRKPAAKPARKPVRKPVRAAKPARSVKPAAWYRAATGKADVAYIRESVKELRQFYTGFEARDGFSLRLDNLRRMSRKRYDRIRRMARQIRIEKSAAHVILAPRTPAERAALVKHTGAPAERNRKAWVVHVPNDRTTVVLRTRKGVTRVVEVSKKSGAASKREYFYFTDYRRGGRRPKTMQAIYDTTKRMLNDMPEGLYLFVSRDFGFIASAMYKSEILREIERNWLIYDKFAIDRPDSRGLAESLIGFARISTTFEGAAIEYRERLTRRLRYKRERARIYESKRTRRRRLTTGRA